MKPNLRLACLLFAMAATHAQIDPNFDRNDPNYDRNNPNYDRNNPNFDRNNPNFDRNNPNFDRNNPNYDRNNPYQQFGSNQSQFGSNNSQFDRNNQRYDPNNPNYDRNNPNYDRNNPSFDRNNPNFDRNNPNFDRNNPNFDRNNPNYDRNNPNYNQYDRFNYNNTQYNNSQYDRYNSNNSQYDRNNPNFDRNNPNFDRNNPNYDRNNPNYDRNNPNYDRTNQNYDRYNQNYDRNNPNYDRNNPNYNRNNQRFDPNNPNTRYDTNTQFGDLPSGNTDNNYGSPGGYGNNDNDNCCEEYCYASDEEPYIQFGSKTAYDSINNNRRSGQQHSIPECEPVQFWSVNRHGTRYPGHRRMAALRNLNRIQEEIVRNYEQRRSFPDRGKLCARDFDLIKRWRWNETITERQANALTAEGIGELKRLARRYKTRFAQLFREPYSDRLYHFQYTDTDRTQDSYQAYIEGLFEREAYNVRANIYNDRLIKPYKHCDTWQDQVNDNPNTYDEYRRWTERPEYAQMVRNVFRRLGFKFSLNSTIIYDIYEMCRYEKAWHLEQRSPWCIAFNKEQLKMLEYGEDLKSYYSEGYGNPLNKKVGCPLVKDLYDKFERTVSGGSDGNKASFYFTHAATINTLLTAMGISEDQQPLRADNYYQQSKRHWKSSNNVPFAANLAAVLYQCRGQESHKVMFFLNEVPVEFSDCSVGLCNWSTFQNKFRYVAEQCNLDFCNGNSGNMISTSSLSLAFAIISFLIYFRH